MNIYVSNLNFKLQDEDLKNVFTPYGEVSSAKVIRDNQSGRSRGFGFVEMPSDDDARAAIEKLNGTEVDGRTIVVNEARPRKEGENRGGGGGFKRRGGFDNRRERDFNRD
ncbi:MAG: RNA-binding protein [Bacteroidetes bacterium]|nr:RNA-binding protein [Bacteroidota bacterium]